MSKLQCFCVSDMNVDMVVEGNARPTFGQVEKIVDKFLITVGGSANIFACQFAKIGGRIGLLGAVGVDAFGAQLMRELGEAGIDLTHVREDPSLGTGLSIALVEGSDRAILTWPGTIDVIGATDLTPDLLDVAEHWHIASYFLLNRMREVWPRWLPRLRERGVTVSLDTNWAPDGDWDSVRALFPHVDVFLPNDAEAMAISGQDTVIEAGRMLAQFIPLVVIKCGEDGAMAFDGTSVRGCKVPEALLTKPVDTVGAGDCFDAGFLRGWLAGKGLQESMHLGHRCAAASVRGQGGVLAQLKEAIE